MRALAPMALVLSGLAAVAAAQTTGVVSTPTDRSSARLARDAHDAYQFQVLDRQPYEDSGRDAAARERQNLLRAAAWGRCVVASATDHGALYLRSSRSHWQDPAEYHGVFEACRRRTGPFTYDHRPMVLRAAVAEGLRRP